MDRSVSSILEVDIWPVVDLGESVEEWIIERSVLLIPEWLQDSCHLRRMVVQLWVVRVHLSLSQEVQKLNALIHVEVEVADSVTEHELHVLFFHDGDDWRQLVVNSVVEADILLLAVAVLGEIRV